DEYDVSNDYRYVSFPGEQRRRTIPATRISFFVPFTGEEDLFRCRPSNYNLNPPRAEIRDREVIISMVDPQPDAGRARQHLNEVLGGVRQYISWVNSQVAAHNGALPGIA